MKKPIPASDASTLAYLAEFPDVEPEDKERLLAALSEEGREIAKVLLGEKPAATPETREQVEGLKSWAASESSLR